MAARRDVTTPKMAKAADRVCYHCKAVVRAGEAHDCWTTTEHALTKDLPEDLKDAWERLRETAVEFGEQRIYASHHSIMFARKACFFFVRPRKAFLEVCVFLNRGLKAPHVRSVTEVSRTKRANMLRIVHRDEVEAPITDWLKEAYDVAGAAPKPTPRRATTVGTRKRANSSTP